MWGEREAIINMLIPAAQMVRLNSYNYIVPKTVEIARGQYRIDNSPVLAFSKSAALCARKGTV